MIHMGGKPSGSNISQSQHNVVTFSAGGGIAQAVGPPVPEFEVGEERSDGKDLGHVDGCLLAADSGRSMMTVGLVSLA